MSDDKKKWFMNTLFVLWCLSVAEMEEVESASRLRWERQRREPDDGKALNVK